MFSLIKDGQIVADEWKTLTLSRDDTPQSAKLPVGPTLVPLPIWRARRAELIHREYEHGWPLGVWLAAGENPEEIRYDIDDFSVIAVVLDSYPDSRAHAAARTLREDYGFKGELRGIGDVSKEEAASHRQFGFDTFAVPQLFVRGERPAGSFLPERLGISANRYGVASGLSPVAI